MVPQGRDCQVKLYSKYDAHDRDYKGENRREEIFKRNRKSIEAKILARLLYYLDYR